MSPWDNNPVGIALAAGSGVLVLGGLLLNLAWRGEVTSDSDAVAANIQALPPLPAQVEELGAMGDYDEVNNRPLFNETRRPVVIDLEVAELEEEPVVEEVIAAPPEVRLTGVVITPTKKVVTLTPKAGGEAVVIREGMPLDGEFVGWSVDSVQPREVSLRSRRGETVRVELMVHDTMIEAPPEPVVAPNSLAEQVDAAVAAGEGGEDGNRTRADEIRERIRQRREQLRQEAEAAAAEQEAQNASTANAYQDAIRSMMQRNNTKPGDDSASDDDSGDE